MALVKPIKKMGILRKMDLKKILILLKEILKVNNIEIRGLLSYIKSDVEYDSFGFVTGVQDGDERSITEEFTGNLTIKFNLFGEKLENTFSFNQSDISRDYFTDNNLTFGADGDRKLYRYQGNAGFGNIIKLLLVLKKKKAV
jgi:hypothetical protein